MTFRGASCLAAWLLVSLASEARADLGDDVDGLAARLRREGATVQVLRARYVSAGASQWLSIPVEFLEGAPDACTTVTVLGALSTVFHLRTVAEPTSDEITSEQIPAVAGAATIRRCGEGRGMLLHVLIDMRSPHGVLEAVVASSRSRLPDLREVLPHRNPGVVVAPVRPGPPPLPAPLVNRIEAAAARLGLDPGASIRQVFVPSNTGGAGRVSVELGAGCNRFLVLGVPDEHGNAPHDIDAELSSPGGDVLDSDRTESADASLDQCVGESRRGFVQFAGSAPRVPVLLLHSTVPLPAQAPAAWGADARARFAMALLPRRIPAPTERPSFVTMGVAGTTRLPVELEPGQCYLGAIVAIQGDVRLLSLRAETDRERRFAQTDGGQAAVVSFCANGDSAGLLEIDVRGSSLSWGGALWPLGRSAVGQELP